MMKAPNNPIGVCCGPQIRNRIDTGHLVENELPEMSKQHTRTLEPTLAVSVDDDRLALTTRFFSARLACGAKAPLLEGAHGLECLVSLSDALLSSSSATLTLA